MAEDIVELQKQQKCLDKAPMDLFSACDSRATLRDSIAHLASQYRDSSSIVADLQPEQATRNMEMLRSGWRAVVDDVIAMSGTCKSLQSPVVLQIVDDALRTRENIAELSQQYQNIAASLTVLRQKQSAQEHDVVSSVAEFRKESTLVVDGAPLLLFVVSFYETQTGDW